MPRADLLWLHGTQVNPCFVQTLLLGGNQLIGGLQPSWGSSIAWSALVHLSLSGNPINGSLPVSWGFAGVPRSGTTSMLVPTSLCLSLPPVATAPLQASPGFITVHRMPPAAATIHPKHAPQAAHMPEAHGLMWPGREQHTQHRASLLQAVGDRVLGAGAFPVLQVLQLEYTGLQGTLPSSWGVNNSFPQLAYLNLAGNCLTGTLPAWGNAAASSLPVLTVGIQPISIF